MKTTREHLDLLEDVLSESASPNDSLALTLKAVRMRRQRRNLSPIAGILVLAGIAWICLDASWRGVTPGIVGGTSGMSSRPIPSPPMDVVQRVNSVALDPAERVATPTYLQADITIHSESRGAVWASDEDLLVLAGGRGVGILRVNGRAQLLVARTY